MKELQNNLQRAYKIIGYLHDDSRVDDTSQKTNAILLRLHTIIEKIEDNLITPEELQHAYRFWQILEPRLQALEENNKKMTTQLLRMKKHLSSAGENHG